MTPRQLEILEHFKAHVAETGVSPTMQTLSERAQLSGKSKAWDNVRALVGMGYLKVALTPGRYTQYELTPLSSTVGTSRAGALTDAELIDEVARRGGILALTEARS